MRVLFISANTERINMPTIPLGLGCVAEATRRTGHEIRLLDLMSVTEPEKVIEEVVKDFPPEVIGISVRNIDDQKMEDTNLLLDKVRGVVSDCRNLSEAPIVLGGAGYSIFPVSALEHLQADMGIRGEGEASFLTLLERFESNASVAGVPGLYHREQGLQGERKFIENLDDFPLPPVDLWNQSYADDPDVWMPVQTRRGCSMDCNYCSTATIEGKRIRKRSPDLVAEWLQSYVDAGFQRFFFTDNIFNLPASYARELCRQILARKLDITWRSIIYPVRVDENLAGDMARAGGREVSLGFESGSENILNIMNKRFKPDDIRHTCALLKECGVRRMGFLLLGGPGETKESVEESLAFADSLELEMLKITIGIRIYPETALAKTAVDEGIIASEQELLFPKFYLRKDIEDWLRKTVRDWLARRPNWIM